MAIWHIDSEFEKNSTFETVGCDYYVLVQDGKVIGDTNGKTAYKSKTVKLNKKFFNELKCGFFSKKVKVDIFHVEHSFNLTSYGIGTRAKCDYMKAPGEEYIVECSLGASVMVDDAVKIYRNLIENIGGLFYTTEDLRAAFKTLVERELEQITHSLTLPAGRYNVSKLYENKPEIQQIYAELKKRLTADFKNMGYKLNLNMEK
jgi:hypothetical protein